jgi:hypothetical protein
MVGPGGIPAVVAAELARLKPKSIVILGGTSAVSDAVATALTASTTGNVMRQAGADRYATAVAISQAAFPTTAGTASLTDSVYLATGTDFPDALAGGVVAALAHAPLLLVPSGCVPLAVGDEITRLAPAHVSIFGGANAVSPAVERFAACGAGAGPAVSVSPATGLTDGGSVQVVATGFTPGLLYAITECGNKGVATSGADCAPGVKNVTANVSGAFDSTFSVVKGPFGANNIVCAGTQACMLVVSPAGVPNPTEVAVAAIAFS